MAFTAQELRGDTFLSVRSHLAQCAECRLETERLGAYVAQPPGAPPALKAVLEKVRRKETERSAADPGGQAAKSRAAGAIAAYLGGRAADRIVKRASAQSDDLLAHIEPVLALFLGGKAAAELTGRVVDGMIVQR